MLLISLKRPISVEVMREGTGTPKDRYTVRAYSLAGEAVGGGAEQTDYRIYFAFAHDTRHLVAMPEVSFHDIVKGYSHKDRDMALRCFYDSSNLKPVAISVSAANIDGTATYKASEIDDGS